MSGSVHLTNEKLNKYFMLIPKRAEGVDRATLVQTFVDLEPLITLLSTKDHQVVYGRRGTGKTHALLYLSEVRIKAGDIAAYTDMRTIGSSGGIYSDASKPISERGTRLLIDTLEALHESLLSQVVHGDSSFDLSSLGPKLDRLADAISTVRVVGTTEQSETVAHETVSKSDHSLGFSASSKGLSADLSDKESSGSVQKVDLKTVHTGTVRHHIHFGSLASALTEIAKDLGKQRIWLILDEWSAIPLDLQPLLADLIRRSILPVSGITVKLGAIEHRSLFQESRGQGDYIGVELGADMAADVNLDDFMVFDNSAERAKTFFSQLIYKHSIALALEDENSLDDMAAESLIAMAFTRQDVFEEYVRASEGVPRDAINILSLAARQAMSAGISMENVRVAARLWYERDKQAAVDSNGDARDLLFQIIDEVIGHRRTRAFLLQSNTRHLLVDDLFDKRVLHILKRNISSNDQPGVRYDVFKIDYGCYVDLLTTAKAPQGLLELDTSTTEPAAFIEVPPDDYRAIRRAILDLSVPPEVKQ